MEKLSFRVAEYDAPLDLILHLISLHKLDIIEIDITSLLEQYMTVIQAWQSSNMDIASEFLEMASRLVYIKTVSLLPKHEEETTRLKQELAGQLIEYQLCKVAAQQLGSIGSYGDIYVRPQQHIPIDPTYTLTHPSGLLYSALADALGRGARRLPPPQDAFAPLVTRPVVSVASKIFGILRTLRLQGSVSMDALLLSANDRSSLVATFLAMLELMKSGKILFEDDTFTLRKTSQPQHQGQMPAI